MSNLTVRATVICRDPLIIYSGSYLTAGDDNEFLKLAYELRDKKITVLKIVAWSAEANPDSKKNIAAWRSSYLEKFPNHRIIFLSNTYGEVIELRSLGVETEFIHQNIFIDEELYKPVSGTTKIYDAVYNGQFLDFKRHYLAANISPLCLIGYNFDTDYGKKVRLEIPHATYSNRLDDSWNFRWLNQSDVNLIYNQSHVGLCLSKVEGAMHASAEYLLSGIPVVTTLNQGGRDYFFQGDFVLWSDDKAEAVLNAVQCLKSRNINPEYIRSETLRKIYRDRNIFFDFMNKLCGDDPDKIEKMKITWRETYNDKLLTPKPISHFIE